MPGWYKFVQILDKIHLGPKEVNMPTIIGIFKGPLEDIGGLVILLTSLLLKLYSEVTNKRISESRNSELY